MVIIAWWCRNKETPLRQSGASGGRTTSPTTASEIDKILETMSMKVGGCASTVIFQGSLHDTLREIYGLVSGLPAVQILGTLIRRDPSLLFIKNDDVERLHPAR